MNIYKKVRKYRDDLVEYKVFCDVCKKDITHRESKFTKGDYVTEEFYKVTTSHRDWGNDSIDSVECKDVCSDECLKVLFDEYLDSRSSTKEIKVEKDSNYYALSSIENYLDDKEYNDYGYEIRKSK